MSKQYVLSAELRQDEGKGASRRLRRIGGVPAIVYGAGTAPVSITLKHNELSRALQDEAFYSQVITLNLGSGTEQVVLRDLQRHPAKPVIMHADLQRVQSDHLLRVVVPLHFVNVETSTGVKVQGGVLNISSTNVEVNCLPGNIPAYIEVDVSAVEKGHILHLSDIKFPEGVSSAQLALGESHNQPIAAIH